MGNLVPDEYDMAIRARDGDRAALAELTSRTRARLFALAYSDLHHFEDANDAVASGLLQICRHIEDLREPERIVAWMQSIVRNEARRIRRGAAGATSLPLLETDVPAYSEPYSLLRIDIERSLQEMPLQQAEVMRQFYFNGSSVQAIARDIGVSEGAVKMSLYRGRQHLRAELEGYSPVTGQRPKSVPGRPAAVLLSELEPQLCHRIKTALHKAGYSARFLKPSDIGEVGSTEPGPWDVLKSCSALVIVEPFGERSVFEYILLLRASWETADIPVAVVTNTLDTNPLSALAFHMLGVAGLASRDTPESLDCLFNWTGGTGMSRGLKAVILFADDEARRAGQERIDTEHLLLGLLRDKAAIQCLQDGLNLSPDQIAKDTRHLMQRLPEYRQNLWRNLTAEASTSLNLAHEGAAEESLTTAHLLLGLIREPNGLAGRLLRAQGITPERVRSVI